MSEVCTNIRTHPKAFQCKTLKTSLFLIEKSYRKAFSMVFAAYLLKNAILVLSRVGHLHPIIKPHRGAFVAFPKQNDKCPTCARLELTEPYFCALLLCGRRESNKFADQIRIELQELRKHA